MIGGGGAKKTLKLVARYADACNLIAALPGAVAHKLDALRRYCDDEGRDYAGIRKTATYAAHPADPGERDAFTRQMAGFAALGIDTVIVSTPPSDAARWIERYAAPAAKTQETELRGARRGECDPAGRGRQRRCDPGDSRRLA